MYHITCAQCAVRAAYCKGRESVQRESGNEGMREGERVSGLSGINPVWASTPTLLIAGGPIIKIRRHAGGHGCCHFSILNGPLTIFFSAVDSVRHTFLKRAANGSGTDASFID